MKYKIKVEVMKDGTEHFIPKLKKHWWQPWGYIGLNGLKTYCSIYTNTMEEALDLIRKHQEIYRSCTIDTTYDIPVDENYKK